MGYIGTKERIIFTKPISILFFNKKNYMENDASQYGQMDFNLPHDVVQLPSRGVFYKSKKKSVKVGYLTASDENILSNINSNKTIKESIVLPLLRGKIYESDLRPEDLLDGDVEALLLYLRNTSFGPEYVVTLKDPGTGKEFEATILLDELNIQKTEEQPNDEGYLKTTLPRSKASVTLKFLTMRENIEIDHILESYPSGIIPPTHTLKLSKMIVDIDGNSDRGDISKFIETMPIMDSKHIKKFMSNNESRLDLNKEVIAPSGERVNVSIAFGVEFFRPFF